MAVEGVPVAVAVLLVWSFLFHPEPCGWRWLTAEGKHQHPPRRLIDVIVETMYECAATDDDAVQLQVDVFAVLHCF